MEPLSLEGGLNFIECLINHEVEIIMKRANVSNRGGLYNNITTSLWKGESSLQAVYERQIARSKRDFVWNAIQHNAVILSIQEHHAALLKDVTSLFERHNVAASGDLCKQVVDSIVLGEGARGILEVELSQEELEEIKSSLDIIEASGKYQLPSHIGPATSVLDQAIPEISRKTISPPTPSVPDKPPSTKWVQVFQRHSVLWKFLSSDIGKVEEWAVFGFSTKQIARSIVDECKNVASFNRRLYSALFFLAKRRLNMLPFVDSLVECFLDFGVECEQYSLRMLVNMLLSNCDKLVRQKLAHLISVANPIPFTEFVVAENQPTFTQHFTPELYWILDSKFLFFSLGVGGCKGKSSLLNQIFGTSFETSKDSQFFRGTIDYQNDGSTAPHPGVVVADGHGTIDDPFKHGIYSIADGVIVHVQSDTWNANPQLVICEITMAAQLGVRFIIVLVRDVVEPRSSEISKELNATDSHLADLEGDKQPMILIFKLPFLTSDVMAEYYIRSLRERIMDCLWCRFGLSSPLMNRSTPSEVLMEAKKDKREVYLSLLSPTQQSDIEAVRSVLDPLLGSIAQTIRTNRVHDSSFLATYPKFKAIQQLRNSLMNSHFETAADSHMRRLLLMALTEEIKQTDIEHLPEAVTLFEAIIVAGPNSKLVMEFVEWMKKIVDEEVLHGSDITLSDVEESKAVCIELFWREINQLYLLGRSSEEISSAFRSFLQAGEPFELIDGDNMYFPFQLLYYSLKIIAPGKRLLVVGTLGPQGSGKSTLLNVMFGCGLARCTARTTKGVYGTLMDSPIEEYDLLLILDPEGLNSDNADPQYDRKVVLCMLAICNVVLVTVQDQANNRINKTLEVCARSLASLYHAKVPQPIIYFVQNQRPNQYNQQALVDISANLTQAGLRDTLNLSADSFVALPPAFISKDIPITGADVWQKRTMLPKYVQKVAVFTDTMFNSVKQRHYDLASKGNIQPFNDLPTWIQFAHSIFMTTCKFDSLTRYGDLLEEKQDQFVKKWLQIVVDSVVSSDKKDDIFALQDCVTGIETYFDVAATATQNELVDMLEKNQIKPSLYKAHLDTLRVIMENSRAHWIVDANTRIANDRLQHEITNGHALMNNKIRDVLRGGQKNTREQLNPIFDDCFQTSFKDILKRKANAEASIRTLCMSVIDIYKLHCHDLPNAEEVFNEIKIDQDPEVKLQQLLEHLDDSNYEDMTYALPLGSNVIDSRFISCTGWTFVNNASLALMKDGILDHLADSTSNVAIESMISNITTPKPVSDKILDTVSRWLFTAQCAVSTRPRDNMSPSKLASLLVRSIRKELSHSPRLIAKLLDVPRLLQTVRLIAQEAQLQDRLPSTDVIHRCVAQVNEGIITQCDADLLAFGLALSKSMRSRLHLLMLQYLVAYNLRFQTKLLEDPNIGELRDSWKMVLLEQTLRGPARDVTSIDSLINKLEESLQSYCLEASRRVFTKTMDVFQKSATRNQLQLEFERNLALISKEELMGYISDPASTIRQQFDKAWRSEEAKMLDLAQQIYVTEGNSLQPLERWTVEVLRQIESARYSTANDIFVAPSGIGAVQALLHKEKATVMLLCDLLRGRVRSPSYLVDDLEIKIADWNIASSSGGTKIIEKADLLIKLVASVGTISDLLTFAQRLAARLSNVGNTLRRHHCTTSQLDPTNRLGLGRIRALGCTQLCPCCKRCCDEEHWRMQNAVGTGPNRHKCRLGHQYRGILQHQRVAGFAFEKTKFASLKVCGEMRDDDRVWITDRYLMWHEFKAKFPSWDFHFPTYEEKGLDTSRNRMAYIWGQVGEELCIGYDIQYTASDQSYAERTKHFIFLVGATSSMGYNWQYFLRAAQKFADTKLARDPSVSHLASLLLFSYNTNTNVAFRDCVLTPDLFQTQAQPLFPFSGDKTSFSAALAVVCNMLSKQVSRIPVVIILLSDGDDAFPQHELHKLCEDQIWKHIDSFWAIGFGAAAAQGTLMGMAQWMVKGTVEKSHFRNPKDFSELVDQYSEIASQT